MQEQNQGIKLCKVIYVHADLWWLQWRLKKKKKSDKEITLGVSIHSLFILSTFEDHNMVKACD